jgi:hypothetical protein
MTNIVLGTDPFSHSGMVWLKDARGVIDDWLASQDGKYRAFLGGGAAVNTDLVNVRCDVCFSRKWRFI